MHTLEPFVVVTDDDCDGATVRDRHGRIVADCNGCDIPGTAGEVSIREAKANARLIAAAPELLAALELVVSMGAIWRVDPDKSLHTMQFVFDAALAAIAKAKGETP